MENESRRPFPGRVVVRGERAEQRGDTHLAGRKEEERMKSKKK